MLVRIPAFHVKLIVRLRTLIYFVVLFCVLVCATFPRRSRSSFSFVTYILFIIFFPLDVLLPSVLGFSEIIV